MKTQKVALITGISGQDGSLLSRVLCKKGYRVFGTIREGVQKLWRLKELGILNQVELLPVEGINFHNIVTKIEPCEIYNLAGQSSVATSFDEPFETIHSSGMITLELLEVIRKQDSGIRFYQASSSEIYGQSSAFSRDESAPFHPRSPYAVSKLFSHWLTINYREAYDIFACCGILSNHESPLRGEQFVTRKITKHVASYHLGDLKPLEIGNLDVQRDWGYANDFVYGMYLMLQQPKPEDFVLATGKLSSVRDFITLAFNAVNVPIYWKGRGLDEVGFNSANDGVLVRVSTKLFRPSEVFHSLGNPLKAYNVLNWKNSCSLEDLCAEMVEADLARLRALALQPTKCKPLNR